VPGESQGGVATRRQSRLAHWRQCESNRNQTRPARRHWVKRAILPAAISDPAAIRLLAEAESREPLDSGPAGPSGPREMIAWNRTRLTPPSPSLQFQGRHGGRPLRNTVPLAQPVRALVCGTRGHGFEPRKAPQDLTPSPSPSRKRGVFSIGVVSGRE
jgi:hypothetical protein